MHGHHDHDASGRHVVSISCDDCSMQCTSACDDCVVTFLLRNDESGDGLVLDGEQARVVELFGAAGLLPRLRYSRQQVAG